MATLAYRDISRTSVKQSVPDPPITAGIWNVGNESKGWYMEDGSELKGSYMEAGIESKGWYMEVGSESKS